MSYRQHPVTDYESVVDENTQFIDVRQPDEFAGGTLRGATNIALDEFPDRVRVLDPSKRTVLLCRSGGRSARAAEYLAAAGFSDVINLDGGMIAHAKEETA